MNLGSRRPRRGDDAPQDGRVDSAELTTSERRLWIALAGLPAGTARLLRGEQPAGWRARAGCRGRDPELWFPPHKGQPCSPEAVVVCAGCPVRRACLAAALLLDEPYGVWGGHGPVARRQLRHALQNGVAAGDVLDAAERAVLPKIGAAS